MVKLLKSLIPSVIRRKIKLFLNKGDRFVCPFCGYKSKTHAVVGFDHPVLSELDVVGGGLRKGGCFKCGSLDRERLVYIYMREELKIFEFTKEQSILHFAPEAHITKEVLENCDAEYICGDLFTEGYSYPPHVVDMNVMEIPFANNYFDLVICNHVLEHVSDDSKAMSEIYRVLKPAGTAILQVPISLKLEVTLEDKKITTSQERELKYGQFDHVRLYGKDYIDKLQSAGFSAEKLNFYEKYASVGINVRESIYVGKKQS